MQAIWKVILTLTFETDVLCKFMRHTNLINVPIRAIHYAEIMCLFRKAHGQILEVKKIGDNVRSSQQKKKAELVRATDTVQGFVSFQMFCKDLVKMLGDAVLLVSPSIYTLVLQLLFESMTISTTSETNENVVYLKRITDLISPFQNQITDNLPIDKIFDLVNMDMIVKYFCM